MSPSPSSTVEASPIKMIRPLKSSSKRRRTVLTLPSCVADQGAAGATPGMHPSAGPPVPVWSVLGNRSISPPHPVPLPVGEGTSRHRAEDYRTCLSKLIRVGRDPGLLDSRLRRNDRQRCASVSVYPLSTAHSIRLTMIWYRGFSDASETRLRLGRDFSETFPRLPLTCKAHRQWDNTAV